ncbi:MAG: hypothetical protein WAO58_01120 [Fimbriimonadaceae bacterium]
MLATLLASAVMASPAAVSTKVVSASLFKNGYAVIVREAPLANGEAILEDMPQAVLGTLWITASKGVKIREIIATNRSTAGTRDVASLDEVITANIGKSVTLSTNDTVFIGKILSASGSILVIDSDKGVLALNKNEIRRITGSRETVWKIGTSSSARIFRIRADAPANAKLYILSLERGLTWAPAYAADITGDKNLELTAKATILNDLADLDNIDVRLVTGFPNLPFVNVLDPFSIAYSVDQYTQSLMAIGTPSEFRKNAGMMINQAAGYDRQEKSFSDAFAPSGGQSLQAEDLFFYTLPKLTMKKGDRGYFMLFDFMSKFEHVYDWEVEDQVQDDQYRGSSRPKDMPEDVWHSLKFTNNASHPLTTAAAITMKDGEILGQDMLMFTNAGRETTLRITKALDVVAESAEEETGRERKAIAWGGSSNYPFDEITLKGTLSVRNLKTVAVNVRIAKEMSGTLVSADGMPETTKLAKGLRAVNPRQRMKWTIPLKPGEKREIIYTYKVLIRT